MDINKWIRYYHTMIMYPIVKYSGLSGFQLTNNMRIYFSNIKLTQASITTLRRTKERRQR